MSKLKWNHEPLGEWFHCQDVFSLFLKIVNDIQDLISLGNIFNRDGAATEEALSPYDFTNNILLTIFFN